MPHDDMMSYSVRILSTVTHIVNFHYIWDIAGNRIQIQNFWGVKGVNRFFLKLESSRTNMAWVQECLPLGFNKRHIFLIQFCSNLYVCA